MLMACGGCLGTRERRRTWQAARSHGEVQATLDPWISEWGNLAPVMRSRPSFGGGEPGEVKHLSTRRKRKRKSIPLVAASEEGRA